MLDVVPIAGGNHVFVKVALETMLGHIVQRFFRNGFTFNAVMLHQIGQVTDQALVGILCAVVYQNLMIAFQRGQHIHTKGDQLDCRRAVQCGRIHGSICHSCELFDL